MDEKTRQKCDSFMMGPLRLSVPDSQLLSLRCWCQLLSCRCTWHCIALLTRLISMTTVTLHGHAVA